MEEKILSELQSIKQYLAFCFIFLMMTWVMVSYMFFKFKE